LEAPPDGDPENGREDAMTKKTNEEQPLTPEELEAQNGEELPDREAMSLINPGVSGIASGPFPVEGAPPDSA
jgi:hypothetical protein